MFLIKAKRIADLPQALLYQQSCHPSVLTAEPIWINFGTTDFPQIKYPFDCEYPELADG